ncbi:AIR synthase-related protein [Uliginosibacterium sp. H3]|uniref:Phosphoribosylformylglycinamidine cyclo-ligase n=1 Tax=Uliginosibacterium silvisoli TaxID=3114758 RepID=A0ABU6K5N9_9RHOO|nr:AIR synthase-related protein [Uliginosibacterium sp. H3]
MSQSPATPDVSSSAPLDYTAAGVDYSKIDPLKILAQQAASSTKGNLAAHGVSEIPASRGESAYVMEVGGQLIASITECLGTKALVADAVRAITGKTHYDSIAQDTIAMAVNDLITVGATPLSVHAYWSAGGSDWFADEQRMRDLVAGWQKACDVCKVSWGGGETPALAGVVEAGRIDLAASSVGIIPSRDRLTLGDKLAAGDAIVFLASSGIHANGVSLARKLVERLPEGYATKLSDGRLYGEALLDATALYVPVTEALFAAGIVPHYSANITGHGWRKIMRHQAELTYRIHTLPSVPPVLSFIQEHAGIDDREAYGSLNMGAGFAFYVAAEQADDVVRIAQSVGVQAWVAGRVEAGPKQVVIEPLSVIYAADDLNLRA